MCFFNRDNGKLLMLYQGFSKHSNFLSSQLDQTGLSVPILDRDPHQSNNTGSHRLVICQYLVGTWNTETSHVKNIFSHRIWWHSKILFVPPPCRFWGGGKKTFIKLNPLPLVVLLLRIKSVMIILQKKIVLNPNTKLTVGHSEDKFLMAVSSCFFKMERISTSKLTLTNFLINITIIL